MVPVLVILTFVGVVLFFYIRDALVERAAKTQRIQANGTAVPATIPAGYRLCSNHLWVQELSTGSGRIGVDELLQRFIGRPDRITLKNPGDVVSRGESLAVISRDGKELHLASPFDAQVTRTNDELAASPGLIGDDPYRNGWFYQLTPLGKAMDNVAQKHGLDAINWLSSEFVRLRDYLQRYLPKPEPVGATLADGGELRPGLIDFLGQDDINNFERDFLEAKQN
jgi:glycine cleavage system H protein